MNIPLWLRLTLIAAAGTGLFLGRGATLDAAPGDYVISQTPLYLGDQTPPLMMMVLSRDEQLFYKAYSDYTDLKDVGTLNTTYEDTFDYAGYFDSKLCYAYTADGRFKASGRAVGANSHECAGSNWSGNFLNWTSMSRLDILRYVLYGGRRSTDTAAATVLERAHLPSDLHAWVKVYRGSDIAKFTPFTSAPYSFCNVSLNATSNPLIRAASGNWSEWSSAESQQCVTGGSSNRPSSATDYVARVEVCAAGGSAVREEFCQAYSNGVTTNYKPVGLLQSYGESGRLRFGLVTGSYSNPRRGGVVRRNIGRIAGNSTSPGCVAGDEIDLRTGVFCNQGDGAEGIINAINRFKIVNNLVSWTPGSTGAWSDCGTPAIHNRTGGSGQLNNPGSGSYRCSAWGNPIAEMYAEALNYVAGGSPTTSFNAGNDITGMPAPAWVDPYKAGGNSYCADCSILVMSSSLPSFENPDEMPNVPRLGNVARAATDEVGQIEGLSGSYLIGRYMGSNNELNAGAAVATHSDICSAKSAAGAFALSRVRGFCPDTPSMEGSYLLAGLAYKASTTDLRSDLDKPSSHQNTVKTYTVALAENLPKFQIPVGGKTISLSPLCQANTTGAAGIDSTGWRSCFLGAVDIGTKTSSQSQGYVYGRALEADSTAGSFSLVWEDSLWGSDFDNDVVSMLSYCVGSKCSATRSYAGYNGHAICWRTDASSQVCSGSNNRPVVAADEVLVRIENLSAYAGHAMLTGFAVTGSNNDGTHRLALRPGNSNGSVLTESNDPPANWAKPRVIKLKAGSSAAGQLESPLWYAAKYGGFDDRNGDGRPDSGEWDSRQGGVPDNYFFARDPSKLREELERIFEEAAGAGGPTGGGGAGARINAGSFTVETSFTPPTSEDNYWAGNVLGVGVGADGSRGAVLWNAATALASRSASDRNIVVTVAPTLHDADGDVEEAVNANTFSYSNLGGNDAARRAALGIPSPVPAWFTGSSATGANLVAYIGGSQQYEQGAGGPFRSRSSKLGDIVNSAPEIFQPNDNFGYSAWKSSSTDWKSALGTSYQEYLEFKEANRAPVVYVGANDGMLHAFDARAVGGGGELFAFIPAAARGHLFQLANPNYQHRYYVDGGITVSDIATTGNGDWKTMLVGSTGAGGPIDAGNRNGSSVFALDVTDPSNFDREDVRWEITGNNEPNLGSVLGKPLIVPVQIGGSPKWVALFGNGPNSASGFPVLYVADAWSGEILARLRPTTSAYSVSNGLMNVAPIALKNGDGLVDTVYGGDLQGNVWKFDLSASAPSDWNVAFSGAPLFTARRSGVAQPITGGIEAASGPGGGVSLFFGTGRYFAVGDNSAKEVQSLYGIWDNCPANAAASCTTNITNGRDALRGQTITTGVNSSGHRTRTVTRGAVSYVLHRGWYVDLVADATLAGERFIGTPTLQNGKVFFTTYEPTSAVCGSGGGVNWLYGLNVLTGGGGMAGVSLTPEGAGSGEDAVCAGDCGAISLNPEGETGPPTRTSNIFVPPVVPCDPTDPDCDVDRRLELSKCTLVLRAVGASPLFMPRPCGRQSWRQVR